MVNSEGVPTPVELEAFVAGEIGDLALSSVSQTSSGNTSENSRKTRSHETRLARAAVRAVTRALCSPASACSAVVGPGGGGGRAWKRRFRSSRVRCADAILPFPIMYIAPSRASTSRAEQAPTRTGRLSFLIVR